LVQAGYGRSPNVTKPPKSSGSITERHTQDTHASGDPTIRLFAYLIGQTLSLSTEDLHAPKSLKKCSRPLAKLCRDASGNGRRSSTRRLRQANLPQVHFLAISVVTARAALFAPGDAVGVDILIQVTDSKQTSAPNQKRRYFATTHHPVNRSQRDTQ